MPGPRGFKLPITNRKLPISVLDSSLRHHAFLVDGSFEDKGFAAEFGMGEDAAEGVRADVALANVGVAIDVGGQRGFTVIGVNHVHAVEAEQRFGAAQRVAEATLCGNIETRGEQMTGVEAVADGETGKFGGAVAHELEFLEAAAQLTAGAGGVFQEDGNLVGG